MGYNLSVNDGLFCESPLEILHLGRAYYSIKFSPFRNIKTLKSVTIGNNVTSIGGSAFENCSGLTSVEIPDNVTSIGDYAFSGCGSLASVTIPNSVTSIGYGAFNSCSGLTSVEIPDNVTSIGGYAFSDCSGLTSVEIPDNVTSIGGYAFSGCSGLTSVEIPNSVTSVGDYAFSCKNLEIFSIRSVVEQSKALNFGRYVFNSSKLKTFRVDNIAAWCNIDFYDTSTPFNGCDASLYLNDELVTDVVIPEGVTYIGKYVFYSYDKLRNVVIPSSVTSIGKYAFYNEHCVIEMKGETPPALGEYAVNSSKVVVPDSSLDTYKEAWGITVLPRSDAFVTVDVEALENTSGVLEAIGVDKVGSVVKLKVNGSINSYDVIQFRDKMTSLRELDLSETTVVASDKAFYSGNCTKDNDLGAHVFNGLSRLNIVKLPKDLVAIGDYAFYDCAHLRELEIPATVKSIGQYAFAHVYRNSINPSTPCLRSITIPEGVKEIKSNTFSNSLFLETVILPKGLESIGSQVFQRCECLTNIKLPPTVRTIGNNAFEYCSSLPEIRIPSSVRNIGSSAFSGCNRLKKVYTYTVEPTDIQENTFSTFSSATLYVPSFSFWNYYWDDGWKRFTNFDEFNEPYESFYADGDCKLNDETGYIPGKDGKNPDGELGPESSFEVEGNQPDEEEPKQNLGNVNVESNGETGDNSSGTSIIGDNNLHVDELHININVKGGRWYFFAFPFDIFFDDISMKNGSDYVFRYYDGEERAKNGKGGWKEINENHLKAARGYIFQCSADDVLVLSRKDIRFNKQDKYNELVAHVSENLKDASWNFTGNPYLSYYDLANTDYTAPVTVWDGSKYVAIRPGDDDYHFAPYEAFFVQKPEGKDNVHFDGDEQMSKTKSEKKKEKQAAARRARGIDPERLLVNLVLGNGDETDLTRIVFNNRQSLAYETECDASKFETTGVAQIYTIGNDNVHYAINERPADNGRVVLGYSVSAAGFYTIEAKRMDAVVYVKDFKTGTLHCLEDGAYSFSTDAGTFNDRFEILLKGTAPGTTAIDDVNDESVETIYDLQGRKVKETGMGIYIINGEKVVK